VELPTYTSIWRIEKRLYKLYDFRLPMPIPVGQIAVFTAVTVPYIVLLTLFGLPFNHNLFWLYVLPPGLLTWLATRPVLESKRLPELIISQVRYIGEPSTWCRLAPLAERDEVVVFGRVWRRVSVAPAVTAEQARAVTAEQEGIEQREAARELPVPGRAALPVATAAAPGASGQPGTEQPARGRARTGRRDRQAEERQAKERQAREQRVRERAPAGPARGQRVREPVEPPGPRWGRRAVGTMRRQAVSGPAAPASPASEQALPVRDAPPPAAAGWVRGPRPATDAAIRRDAGGAGPATDAAMRRDAAPAPPRTGRHAAPARPAAAAGYPADTGGRPSGPGAKPRPVADSVLLAGAVGYAADASGWLAQDAGSGANPAGAAGAGPAGAMRYAAGASEGPRGRARDSGPSKDAGTGWPGGNGAGSGGAPGSDSALGAGQGPRAAAGTGWPVGYPAATSAPPGAPVQMAGPAGEVGPPADAGPARDAGPAVEVGPAGAAGPAASVGPTADAGPAGAAGPAGSVGPTADAGPAGDVGPDPGPGRQNGGAGLSSAEPGTTGTDATGAGGAKPEQASPPRSPQPSASPAPQPSAPPEPRLPAPVMIVPAQRSGAGPSPAAPAQPRPAPVERALSGPGERRGTGWRGHVTVVPGGRGPGRPDHVKEARSRAVLPLDQPRLVVVLGCTVGAGQTVTALMLADLLAGLRAEPVAALDLNPGPASLTELARVPAITVSALLADRAPGAHAAHRGPAGPAGPARSNRTRGRLDVISQDANAEGRTAMPGLQFERLAEMLASRYMLTLADPGAPAVARLLAGAGQLVLVAPSSPDAAQAVSMTCEWLSGHGHAALARRSIAVLNGVSQRSVRHAEQAELVLRGRCRAIVRVPWDDHLAEPAAERGVRDSLEATDGQDRLARLRPAVLQAYTALAGVLVSSLAEDPVRRKAAR
jgi:MinD-like ATPase involved in chromosome partitioning or flagellar assembly